MAGRGRGRGGMRANMLDQMGIKRNDMPTEPQIGPPDLFPPLQFKPISFPEENLSESYLLAVRKDIKDFFQNSEYYIRSETKKQDIERFSDRYQMLTNKKKRLKLSWDYYPKQLQPKAPNKGSSLKRKSKLQLGKNTKTTKLKEFSIEDKFKELEHKETLIIKEEIEHLDPEEEELEEKDSDLEEEEVVEDEEEADDYSNAYFDNGEDYAADDDDALEEGGVF